MARENGGKTQGKVSEILKEKSKGPSSDSQALRTKSMEEIMGIEASDFGLGVGDVLTPKTSVDTLKQQSEIRHTFNEWLQSIHDNSNRRNHLQNSGNHLIFQ